MKLCCLSVVLSLLQFGASHSFSLNDTTIKKCPTNFSLSPERRQAKACRTSNCTTTSVPKAPDEIPKVEIQSVTGRYRNAEDRKKLPWYRLVGDIERNYHVIEFNVRNNTDQEQAFRIMNCSYYQHWAADNRRIGVSPGVSLCAGNAAILMILKPGESYSGLLPIALVGFAAGEAVEFRMSFTPFRKEMN